MKYLFLVLCSILLSSQKCNQVKTLVNLHFIVVEKGTLTPIPNAQIGNYTLEDGKEVFVEASSTDTKGQTIITTTYKRVQGQPFTYFYKVLKKGYDSKTVDFNTHKFTSPDQYNVKLDTIYLTPSK